MGGNSKAMVVVVKFMTSVTAIIVISALSAVIPRYTIG